MPELPRLAGIRRQNPTVIWRHSPAGNNLGLMCIGWVTAYYCSNSKEDIDDLVQRVYRRQTPADPTLETVGMGITIHVRRLPFLVEVSEMGRNNEGDRIESQGYVICFLGHAFQVPFTKWIRHQDLRIPHNKAMNRSR